MKPRLIQAVRSEVKPIKRIQLSPSDTPKLRNSTNTGQASQKGAEFDLAQGPGRLPSRTPGRLPSRPGPWAGIFPPKTQVDWVVGLGVDWVVDLAPEPGRTQPLLAGLVCAWPNF